MEKQTSHQNVINNAFYEELGEGWYSASDHPVGLLRAENNLRNPWILKEIQSRFPKAAKVLDIGCGAGLLTNHLAKAGMQVSGVDISENSIAIAKTHDSTKSVEYRVANAYELPFKDQSFDVVCAMDVLEHVEEPQKLIQEAARVLKKGGLFFFHTFNRNVISYLVVIKGVEWFVKNTPPHMHVYNLFITPKELEKMCVVEQLKVEKMMGFHPQPLSKAFWKMLWTKEVPEDFKFTFTKSLLTGYCGYSTRQ